jgi:hypothetical protein
MLASRLRLGPCRQAGRPRWRPCRRAPTPRRSNRYLGTRRSLGHARSLAADQPAVLVHGDLHLGNIRPRAIDPHGLVGDPAYEFLQALRGGWKAVAAESDLKRAIDRRFADFAEASALDRDRVHQYTQVSATASALGCETSTGRAQPLGTSTRSPRCSYADEPLSTTIRAESGSRGPAPARSDVRRLMFICAGLFAYRAKIDTSA